MRTATIALLLAPLVITAASDLGAAAPASTVGLWDRFERAIPNDKVYADPYRDVTLDVTYTRPDGSTVKFWGFHDGPGKWRIRMMPDALGVWRYEAVFSDGTPGASGSFRSVPSRLPGPVTAHAPNPIWFGSKNGKPFLMRSLHIGDRFFAENWPPAKRKAFLDWASRQGYNTLSIASHYLSRDEDGRGRGWRTPDLWPLDASEYRKAEAILDQLAARRFVVFPFAGFFGRSSDYSRDAKEQERYVRYVVARFGPYWNMLWNVAGPEPLIAARPFLSTEEIHRLAGLIRRSDPFGHLLTVHNRTGDDPFRDAPWLDFSTLQGPKEEQRPERTKLATWLRDNHHPRKPLYAQETLWSNNNAQIRKIGGADYSDDDIRKNTVVITMSAAALNFGDMKGNSSSGFSGTLELSERQQRRHDAVKHVWDFFAGVPFEKMRPCPELVSAGFCLGEADRDVLVYLERPGAVDVKLAGGRLWDVEWIDARNTRRLRRAAATSNGAGLTTPEGGDDWFLRLRARSRTAGAPTEPRDVTGRRPR